MKSLHNRRDPDQLSLFFCRAWRIALLAGLTGYVFLKGVAPALSQIDADFPGYFTAARIVSDSQDTARLYDDSWFRERIRSYGLESPDNPGKFTPFPPPTALLMLPLAHSAPLTALRVVTAISVLCLIAAMVLLARMFAWSPLDAAVFVLLSAQNIASGLRLGQPYIVISTFCLLGYYLYLTGRPRLAGAALGVFVPIKYYPIIVLVCMAFWREWRVVRSAAVTILAVGLLSIAVLGWKVHQIFLVSVLGNHLTGHLSQQNHAPPFTVVYQSFDTLFDRLFILDPARNPRPLLVAPSLPALSLVLIKAALLLAAVATSMRLARAQGPAALAPAIGLFGILVLLIAPATATYMCVLLWLPAAALIDYFLSRREQPAAYFVLGTYALLGFIPYGHTSPFDGRGGLTVLAYPRLALLLAMFIGCVGFLLRAARRGHPEGAITHLPR